ncbi:cytochrome b/b6 domain-containing protein [Rhodovulum kholense]|uniref:Cytochrome b n=1 Tax=Rhodovulum kholense TaxID=453584 RepID=A0A8E3AR06_9RHOB|nr:cytochrome b/b6 domain-containing protein [Rhodovulum kholense]PTW49822.1 cytochrome b [Rhodovulum kholense]
MTEAAEPVLTVVWDPFVRVYHWSQAALIGAAWITADGWKWGHEAAGYAVAGLILARVVWGLVGPRHARFSDFLHGPGAVLQYLRHLIAGHAPHYLGHNPAGGAMILALLTVTALTGLTGWLQTTDAFWGSDAMEEIHEGFAIAILWLVALHVTGVIVESLRQRENLARAMVTGRKRRRPGQDA